MPPERSERGEPADLPDGVARPFTERDGTRGRLIFIEHDPSENDWDGRYTDAMGTRRRAAFACAGTDRAAAGGGHRGGLLRSDADDLERRTAGDRHRVLRHGRPAALVTFRERASAGCTLRSLLVGILWMAGTMAAFGMRLNFLNFVAFPITFGNGADYGVNVMRRDRGEDERRASPSRRRARARSRAPAAR